MARTIKDQLPNITLIHLEAVEVQQFRESKLNEWKDVPAVPGIRGQHVWKVTSGNILMARTAKDEPVELHHQHHVSKDTFLLRDFLIGQYIAAVYRWYVGRRSLVCWPNCRN